MLFKAERRDEMTILKKTTWDYMIGYNEGFHQGKNDIINEIIRYINQQKVNYGNKNIFNNQIKYLKALDK